MATYVKKVVLGTPVKNVTSGAFSINNLGGVSISGDAATGQNIGEGVHNDLLVYDSSASLYKNLNTLRELKIDAMTFDSNSISVSYNNASTADTLYINAADGVFIDGRLEVDRINQRQLTVFDDSSLTTKFYVDQEISKVKEVTFEMDDGFVDSLQIYDDETMRLAGGNGLTTRGVKIGKVLTVTTDLDSTGANAGVFGSSIRIPILTTNKLGQVTAIEDIAVASIDSINYDSGSGLFTINTSDGGVFSDSINLNPFSTYNLVEGNGPATENHTLTLTATGNYFYQTVGTDRTGSVSGGDIALTFTAGDTVVFTNSAVGDHPMYIKTVAGDGTGDGANGVTGQGTATVTWNIQSPGTYYYQCINHADMVGTITVNARASGNLYYTRSRFDSALGDATSISTIRNYISGAGDIQYDQSTGVFSVDVSQVYDKVNFDSDLDAAVQNSSNIHWYPDSNYFDLGVKTDLDSGAYGTSILIPRFTVDKYGRIDSISEIAVAGVSATSWDSTTATYTISTADGGSFPTQIRSFGDEGITVGSSKDLRVWSDGTYNILDRVDKINTAGTFNLYDSVNNNEILSYQHPTGTDFYNEGTHKLRIGDDVIVYTDLIPNADGTQDLGDSNTRWKDLWISGSSIHLGAVTLADSNGDLSIKTANGSPGDLRVKHLNADSAFISQLTVDSINIGQLNLDSAYLTNVNITTADIDNATLGQVTIDSAYVTQINISQGDIDSLHVDQLNVNDAEIDSLHAIQLSVIGAHIDSLYVDQLNANNISLADATIDSLHAIQLSAIDADIDSAHIAQLNVDQLNATAAAIDSAHVAQLNVDQANITDAAIDSAHIAQLNVDQANIAIGDITQANITDALIDSAHIVQLSAIDADIDSAHIAQLNADQVNITDAAIDSAHIDQLDVNSLHVDAATADSARIENLSVDVLNADSLRADFIQLDRVLWDDNVKPSNIEGALYYNSGPDALVYKPSSASPVKIGQDEVTRVYNNSGAMIAKGTPVYVTGAQSDFPTIAKAQADQIDTIANTIGVLKDSINNASFGLALNRGLVGRLNTSGFSVGDHLFVSADSAGKLVTTAPVYPNFAYEIGVVLTVDSAGGTGVGGCAQIAPQKEFFEQFRVTGSGRVDQNFTIGGNLTVIGSQVQTSVQSLAVSDTVIEMGAGDTIGLSGTQFGGTGANDGSLTGHYTGDDIVEFHVRLDSVGGGAEGDKIEWSYDSTYSSLEPFDSANGLTYFVLSSGDKIANLANGVKASFSSHTGHTLDDSWSGEASPINVQVGIVGNYNPSDDSHAYSGLIRDPADNRWKFFQQYLPDPQANINWSDPSLEMAPVEVGTLFASTVNANLTGNVTGTVSDISNHNTNALLEGENNLYFTDARVDSNLVDGRTGGITRTGNIDMTGEIKASVKVVAPTVEHTTPANPITITGGATVGAGKDFHAPSGKVRTPTLEHPTPGTAVTVTGGLEIGSGKSINAPLGTITTQNVGADSARLEFISGKFANYDSGHIGQLSIDSLSVTQINLSQADIDSLYADQINAAIADIDTLTSANAILDSAYVGQLNAAIADIDTLTSADAILDSAYIGQLNVATADIDTLTSADAIIDSAYVSTLNVDVGDIATLTSADAILDSAYIGQLNTAIGDIDTLTSANAILDSAYVGTLNVASADIDTAVFGQVTIDSAYVTQINISQAHIDSLYADNLNFADVNIDNITADSAVITDISGASANFTTIIRSGNTDRSGTYGSASLVPQIKIDASGFVDSINEISVAGVSSTSFDSISGIFTINTADGGSFATTLVDSDFTRQRARESLSSGNSITYDIATGIIDTTQDIRTTASPSFVAVSADSAIITDISGVTANYTAITSDSLHLNKLKVDNDSAGDFIISRNIIQRTYENRDSLNLTPGINQDSSAQGRIDIFVRTAFKSGSHRYYKQGSAKGYYITYDSADLYGSREIQAPHLDLTPGVTYRFHYSDSSMATHDIRFYWDDAKSGLVSDSAADITYTGTAGSKDTGNAWAQIKVKNDGPRSLAYQCINHPYMGNSINTNTTAGSRILGTSSGIKIDGLIEGIIDGGSY